MPIFIELHGVEPEDLKLDQRTGENRHDHTALANLVYGALKNRECDDGIQMYDAEHLAEELSHVGEEVTGVETIANEDAHENITGRRPEYGDE